MIRGGKVQSTTDKIMNLSEFWGAESHNVRLCYCNPCSINTGGHPLLDCAGITLPQPQSVICEGQMQCLWMLSSWHPLTPLSL